MENNDVLRRFRYALNISDSAMVKIFQMAECTIDRASLLDLLKKKDDQGFVNCSTDLLIRFFDGLILYNRGVHENVPPGSETASRPDSGNASSGRSVSDAVDNNTILKKIRIALDLKQDDMLEIFKLGKVNMAKGEFTAFFRKKGHKNYKECGDQFMKKFFDGLALKHRM